MSKQKIVLTHQQQASIYCIKHGHASYIWNFFGYVHCGRCGSQIGDRLGGIFDISSMMIVGHKCKTCNSLKKKQSKLDKEILSRLEKNKESTYDYEKILEGIKFNA